MALRQGTYRDEPFVGSATASDVIAGGGGYDTDDYSSLPAGYSLNVTLSALGSARVRKFFGATLAGTDTISGISLLIGTDGSDFFNASGLSGSSIGSGVFSIRGGAGNDTILGGGRQSIEADYSGASTGVVVNLLTGVAQDGQGGADSLVGVVRVRGSNHDDQITGGDRNDVFAASKGSDTYDGGAGTNTLDYASLDATGIVVTLTANATGTALKGGYGTDSFANVNVIQGGAGGDSILGFAGTTRNTLLRGMAGNDTIDGGGNALNTVEYVGSPTGISVDLAAGTASDGFGSTDTLRNIRALQGSDYNDSIKGGSASELFYASLGMDSYDGGAGTDTLNFARLARGPVRIAFDAAGIGTVSKGLGGVDGTDTFTGIESIVATDLADDIGGHIVSQGTPLWLDARRGNDTVRGYGVTDNIADYINSTGPLNAVLGSSGSVSLSGGETDVLLNVVAIRGTNQSDKITGSAAAERFYGSRGNDTILGGGGPDTLDYSQGNVPLPISLTWTGTGSGTVSKGASGTDSFSDITVFIGTSGNDSFSGATSLALTITGGGGVNTLSYRGLSSGVQVAYADSGRNGTVIKPGLLGIPAMDVFSDMAIVIGSTGNDTLTGGIGISNSWNDHVELRGGAGNDLLDGRNASRSIASYADSPSAVVVQLQTSMDVDGHHLGTASDGWGSTDTLRDVVRVLGSNYADSIIGSHGNDVLDGGLGNDTLVGGTGFDVAVYNRPLSWTTLTRNADGSWTADGPLGTDLLRGIEAVRFDAGTFILRSAAEDFTGNGTSDILFTNTTIVLDDTTYRAMSQWQFSNGSFAFGATFALVDPAWSPVTTGDFNGDEKADILWQHTDGRIAVWLMDGISGLAGQTIYTPPSGAAWSIEGTGDFNRDGRTDILVSQQLLDPSGTPHLVLQLWEMNGLAAIATSTVASVAPTWWIDGIDDFNGDGRADILWRGADGALSIWLMDGASYLGGGTFSYVGPEWSVAGTDDFNRDGKADILWRSTDGSVSIWLMDGTAYLGGATIGNPGTEWTIDMVGDFNGDSKADILWRHAPVADGSSTEMAIWLMDGLNVTGGGTFAYVENEWQVV